MDYTHSTVLACSEPGWGVKRSMFAKYFVVISFSLK